ncbi:unnamed protein product [Callosobruchus maculatus]|nr:unnamed protein product [Callosobruchus maculatus]
MNQPKLYSQSNTTQLTDNTDMLNNHLKMIEWHKEENILEIGVGDGRCTTELLIPSFPKDFHSYVGTDISESMVEFAKENYKLPRVKFMKLDIQSPEIPATLHEKFHHIFSMLCLHWVRNNRQASVNMFNLLRPGGEILCSLVEQNSIDDAFFNLSKNPKWAPYGHEKYLTRYFFCDDVAKEWEKHLIDAGFVDVKVIKEEKSYVYDSEENYKNFYLACNPIVKQIPCESTSEYLNDFFEECKRGPMTEITYSDEKKQPVYKLNYVRLVLYARKPSE